jgi:hypothetical protein
MAIFMGVFPNVFLKPMEPAVTSIVQRIQAHTPATAHLSAPDRTHSHPSAPDRTGGAN